jgi:hypothetical protein
MDLDSNSPLYRRQSVSSESISNESFSPRKHKRSISQQNDNSLSSQEEVLRASQDKMPEFLEEARQQQEADKKRNNNNGQLVQPIDNNTRRMYLSQIIKPTNDYTSKLQKPGTLQNSALKRDYQVRY